MVCETDPNKCSVFNMGGKIVLLIFSRKFTIAISAMTDRNCHEDKVHNRPTVAVELEIFSLWSNGAMCVAVGRVWNFLGGFCFHSKCREGDRRFFLPTVAVMTEKMLECSLGGLSLFTREDPSLRSFDNCIESVGNIFLGEFNVNIRFDTEFGMFFLSIVNR